MVTHEEVSSKSSPLMKCMVSHVKGSKRNSSITESMESHMIETENNYPMAQSIVSHIKGCRNPSPLGGTMVSHNMGATLTQEQEDEEQISFLPDAPAYVEYESDSDPESGPGDSDDQVITAFLHIPLYSPVQIRTGTQISKPASEKMTLPLSPLSQLSQKLAQRMSVYKDSLESSYLRDTATQTSVCSSTSTLLRSPTPCTLGDSPYESHDSPDRLNDSPHSITSSDLPSLSPCQRVPVMNMTNQHSSETPSTIESSSSDHMENEDAAKDSLQDIIFDKEETEKVRKQQEHSEKVEESNGKEKDFEEECSPCIQCKEKQKRNYSVRFNMTIGEERRNRKKKSIFEIVIHCLLKLRQTFKSKCLC